MRYYKIVSDGYFVSIGTGNGGTEITEQEYNEIMTVIRNAPQETDTIGYMLKADLTWEAYEKEPVVVDDTTAEEVLAILTGEQE